MFDQDFVARFKDRSHGKMICHGRSRGFHDAVRIDTVMHCDGFL
jgi:hypothetical protein